MAMFLTLDYITLSVIALGVVLLVAERSVKRFGRCSEKDKIADMIHDLREMFLEVSSRSVGSKSSSDEIDTVHILQ